MNKKEYLTSLSSLRGIAAILVILFHVNVIIFALAPWDSYFSHFIRKGYLWVDFFFLLSGFIMMHVYSESFKSNIRGNFRKFMRSRFARIYPLHLFSFLCMVAYYFWYRANFPMGPNDYAYTFNMQAIWSNLFLIHSLDIHNSLTWNSASWSISTEWWMYVIFPFLLIPFRKISDWKKILILFSVIAGYLFVIYYLHPMSMSQWGSVDPQTKNSLDVTYDYGFVRCFFGFLFGMLLYELYRIGWARHHLKKDIVWILTVAAVITALSFPLSDFIPVILFGSIILVSVYSEGVGRKILNLKPLIYLGDISYSLYLMHLPIMFFLFNYFKRFSWVKFQNPDQKTAWFYTTIFLIVVIVVSSLTYRFVEMPMRQKINRNKRG